MIVPKYWAEARLQHKADGKQRTLYRHGWSDASQEDAQRMADERVREAMQRALAGESLAQRDRKVAYNGVDGLPIREEILETHGTTVITRNSYGARCLNTPDVLIADIDFEQRERPQELALGCGVALVAAVLVCFAFGRFAIEACPIGAAAGLAVAYVLRLVQRARVRVAGGGEALGLARLRAFCRAHPTWRTHVYRTPAGLRVIATHRRFSASEPDVTAFFEALDVDPMYRTMCRLQRCFRARLTAKPWRIGIASHLKPRPGVWPVRAARRAERSAWIAAYEAEAESFAACRHLEEIGEGAVDDEADAVRRLHDALSKARSELPIN